jgi:hypothetical protein
MNLSWLLMKFDAQVQKTKAKSRQHYIRYSRQCGEKLKNSMVKANFCAFSFVCYPFPNFFQSDEFYALRVVTL